MKKFLIFVLIVLLILLGFLIVKADDDKPMTQTTPTKVVEPQTKPQTTTPAVTTPPDTTPVEDPNFQGK